jgi:hypothetical protein
LIFVRILMGFSFSCELLVTRVYRANHVPSASSVEEPAGSAAIVRLWPHTARDRGVSAAGGRAR